MGVIYEPTKVSLGEPVPPAPRSTAWVKADKSSMWAHRIAKTGSSHFVTACRVLVRRAGSLGATSATSRCPECLTIEQAANTRRAAAQHQPAPADGSKYRPASQAAQNPLGESQPKKKVSK